MIQLRRIRKACLDGAGGQLGDSGATEGMGRTSVCVMTSVHAANDTRIFLKECRSIALAGYRVTLIAARGDAPQSDGVEIRRVRGHRGRVARATLTVLRVCREAIRVGADVYHFHDPELVFVGLLLRLMGKKVVFDIHEDIPRDILCKEYLPSWMRPMLSRFAEGGLLVLCRGFSGIVAATPAIAELFDGTTIKPIIVQNFPLEKELFRTTARNWAAREPLMGYVGGITAIRGAREMVVAVGILRDALKARLQIAGTFLPASLRRELAEHDGWSRVDYAGELDRSGVAAMLGRIQAGLVLFHPDPAHLSAYPTKMFEYMSAGIPVIASNFPLWKRIIEGVGCGLTVDPLDPRAIAAAMTYILTHPREAEVMGRRGLEAVRSSYNWASEEKRLLALYATLE